MKAVLALLLVLGVGFALAVRTTAAPAAGLNWELNGTGSGSTSAGSSGVVLGQYVGSGGYTLSALSPIVFLNSTCVISQGSGTITAADGSGSIPFVTVGLVCPDSTGLLTYNATFRIIPGGTNRFSAAAGGGTLALTYNATNFLKMDGTITF